MPELSNLKNLTRGFARTLQICPPADCAPRHDICKLLSTAHSVILVCTPKNEIVVEVVIFIITISAV